MYSKFVTSQSLFSNFLVHLNLPTNICLFKLAIETLEKGAKYVQGEY